MVATHFTIRILYSYTTYKWMKKNCNMSHVFTPKELPLGEKVLSQPRHQRPRAAREKEEHKAQKALIDISCQNGHASARLHARTCPRVHASRGSAPGYILFILLQAP